VLFGFIYPAEQGRIPGCVLSELIERLKVEAAAGGAEKICRGPLLSRGQYLIDTEAWGYRDPRLPPGGRMTAEQITHWTAAIDR
jgi:hypothetical protein